MRRLDDGQELQTETQEFGLDGLRAVETAGPVIRVGGSVLLLLETRQEVKWVSDAALNALASSPFIEEQEDHFLQLLNQLPDEPPAPLDLDRMEALLSDALDPKHELTPLETLVAGCEGPTAGIHASTFGDTSTAVVFIWEPEGDDRDCRVDALDELPMLILQHGSLSVALLTLKGLYTASKWMLAGYGWVRPNFTSAGQAANWFVDELRNRAFALGHGAMPLDRLDQKHSMAVVYVHGLFSTDAGTFDGFRDAWSSLRIRLYTHGGLDRGCVEDAFDRVGHVGFPHDTLCGIDRSGQALADALYDRFETSDTKLALITHSRGGLVAPSCHPAPPIPKPRMGGSDKVLCHLWHTARRRGTGPIAGTL